MARVAVEENLSNVKQALENEGHDVVNLEENNMQNCQCCVITGQDQNMMGMADTHTQASIINADGLSANEVVNQVNQCLNK
ncbi:YkuS family protein [Chengkuizengella axinellae]|uniref:YkuS family protein n=1 Tax=Chengkuizengella axinellae TaxID=3064388 RepID=A0ABT9ITE6_9BACL|nr:YkuS family protein [Chengkuizengella sp. 2205SS18-9]MDP5272629.1 YkuS family protein [Chengkuizengella sp. 2205SS18-9]